MIDYFTTFITTYFPFYLMISTYKEKLRSSLIAAAKKMQFGRFKTIQVFARLSRIRKFS